MNDSVHRFASLSDAATHLLAGQWQICRTLADELNDPATFNGEMGWLDVPEPAPIAAALRALGHWSIDDNSLRFDAFDWWYKCNFDIPAQTHTGHFFLVFGGLATITEAWLNGELLLKSNNMFHNHVVDISGCLAPTDNQLIMVFRSLDQSLKQRRPRPRWRAPMMEHHQLRYVRSSILGRTPGWSPPCPVIGPWRPIHLLPSSEPVIQHLKFNMDVSNGCGIVTISFAVQHCNEDAEIDFCIKGNQQQAMVRLNRDSDKRRYFGKLAIDSVQLWWPHTHGEPAVYSAELCIQSKGLQRPLIFDLGLLGFRTIQVDCADGSFTINVNGCPIFCRGGSWMPLDTVSMTVSRQAYISALTQLKASGINMLRIPGTGCYETNEFYELCDEFGIMVWQEFMFAGMDYPEDTDFITSVVTEAEQQLAQWQIHPSIVVICGNAEVGQQAAMWGANRTLWNPELFTVVLADLAQKRCSSAFYWPSATHGGAFPHQCHAGTAFYYGFGAYLRPPEDLRLANLRFATECLAIANIPERSNLKLLPGAKQVLPKVHHPVWKLRSPRDLGGAGWDFDDVRDYYLAYFFNVDPMQLRYVDHERYLLLSKITSGEMMALAFTEWRSELSSCNGALIWFLNDLWPGAGWGIIDSEGHPKSCYYYLKRVWQPVSVLLGNEALNGYYVHTHNELDCNLTVIVEAVCYKAGNIVVASGRRTLELNARQSKAESLTLWFDGFMDFGFCYRFGPAIADCIYLKMQTTEGISLAETYAFPAGLANFPNYDLGLQVDAKFSENGDVQLDISCRKLAVALYFDVDGFIPDDAYFHLVPEQTKSICFRSVDGRKKGFYAQVNAINGHEPVSVSMSP